MNVNTKFSFKRVFHLILNDLRLTQKAILLATLTVVLFCIVLPFSVTTRFTAYYLILFVGGFIVTSMTFTKMRSSQRAYQFLMLPCSNLERFISKWLITSVGYALGALVLYYIFSILGTLTDLLIFKVRIGPVNIFQYEVWHNIANYIILQTFVFLGAVYFQKYALIKTAFVAGCLYLLFFIYTKFFADILALSYLQTQLIEYHVLQILLYLFAVLSLYVSYLRLTEYELK